MTQTQQEDIPLPMKTMKKLLDYEKQQTAYEKKQTEAMNKLGFWFILNTIATVITGVAASALMIIQIFFQ